MAVLHCRPEKKETVRYRIQTPECLRGTGLADGAAHSIQIAATDVSPAIPLRIPGQLGGQFPIRSRSQARGNASNPFWK
jgi:hypothetical protein